MTDKNGRLIHEGTWKTYANGNVYVVVNGKIMRDMEKVHLHMLVVMYMMMNGKMVTDMEKVHIHRLVVLYMLVNSKMISDMEKAKRLSQMVRSFTKECGNMINQFDEYIYYM